MLTANEARDLLPKKPIIISVESAIREAALQGADHVEITIHVSELILDDISKQCRQAGYSVSINYPAKKIDIRW